MAKNIIWYNLLPTDREQVTKAIDLLSEIPNTVDGMEYAPEILVRTRLIIGALHELKNIQL